MLILLGPSCTLFVVFSYCFKGFCCHLFQWFGCNLSICGSLSLSYLEFFEIWDVFEPHILGLVAFLEE